MTMIKFHLVILKTYLICSFMNIGMNSIDVERDKYLHKIVEKLFSQQ